MTFCSRCGTGIVETRTGRLCPACKSQARLQRDQIVTIKMRIRLMEAKR